tara:strand:+ start:1096 stop:2424 length:1329 start_codon:yes stop_codon:yes gene_type:complete
MRISIHQSLIKVAAPIRVKLFEKIASRQQWTQDRIYEYQSQKLQKIITHCWSTVPFYKNHWSQAGIDPLKVRFIEDLEQLPLLTKQHVRDNLNELTTLDSSIKFSEARTGGSTGSPVIFRMTKFDEEMAWAQMYMGWSWAGYKIGAPFLVVGGESVGTGLSDKRSLKDAVMNRWGTSGSNLTLERTRLLAKSAHFHKITLIYGYPNAIKELGEFLLEVGDVPRNLEGIVCTAEVMRSEVRHRIEEIYGVKVLDQYGLNDGGLHACESAEQNGFNLSFHRGILEILNENGKQIKTTGKPGKAIATCFTNFAMPFIRYETGDNLNWAEAGSGGQTRWQKIGPIDGRTGDVIKLPSGRIITMPGLTLVMRWVDGLKQYQFIQTDISTVEVRVTFYESVEPNLKELNEYLNTKISSEISWSIRVALPLKTKNGKVLIIKNEILART